MRIFILLLFLVYAFFAAYPVEAKLLPRFSQKKTGTQSTTLSKSYISARLRSDRKALNVTFVNLPDVKSIEYVLTYKSGGVEQGVTGSVDLAAASVSREIPFGTASAGVYTYHTGITDMRYEVTIALKSGKTLIKKYTVRP